MLNCSLPCTCSIGIIIVCTVLQICGHNLLQLLKDHRLTCDPVHLNEFAVEGCKYV